MRTNDAWNLLNSEYWNSWTQKRVNEILKKEITNKENNFSESDLQMILQHAIKRGYLSSVKLLKGLGIEFLNNAFSLAIEDPMHPGINININLLKKRLPLIKWMLNNTDVDPNNINASGETLLTRIFVHSEILSEVMQSKKVKPLQSSEFLKLLFLNLKNSPIQDQSEPVKVSLYYILSRMTKKDDEDAVYEWQSKKGLLNQYMGLDIHNVDENQYLKYTMESIYKVFNELKNRNDPKRQKFIKQLSTDINNGFDPSSFDNIISSKIGKYSKYPEFLDSIINDTRIIPKLSSSNARKLINKNKLDLLIKIYNHPNIEKDLVRRLTFETIWDNKIPIETIVNSNWDSESVYAFLTDNNANHFSHNEEELITELLFKFPDVLDNLDDEVKNLLSDKTGIDVGNLYKFVELKHREILRKIFNVYR